MKHRIIENVLACVTWVQNAPESLAEETVLKFNQKYNKRPEGSFYVVGPKMPPSSILNPGKVGIWFYDPTRKG